MPRSSHDSAQASERLNGVQIVTHALSRRRGQPRRSRRAPMSASPLARASTESPAGTLLRDWCLLVAWWPLHLRPPATARGGTFSRIVPQFEAGQIVTLSRNTADAVITECGVAHVLNHSPRLPRRVASAGAVALLAVEYAEIQFAEFNGVGDDGQKPVAGAECSPVRNLRCPNSDRRRSYGSGI